MSVNHNFDISHAVKYGVNEAIFLSNLIFWLIKNRANKKHFFEGRTWTYNSYSAFSELFPYWSKDQIRGIVKSLIKQNIIITRQEGGDKRNNGLFYAIKNEADFLPTLKVGVVELPDPVVNSPDGVVDSPDHSLYTYNKPDVKTDINTCEVVEIFNYWKAKANHPRAKLDVKRKSAIEKALKNYSVEDIKNAIDGCLSNDYNIENGFDDIELICRNSTKTDRYIKISKNPQLGKSKKQKSKSQMDRNLESIMRMHRKLNQENEE